MCWCLVHLIRIALEPPVPRVARILMRETRARIAALARVSRIRMRATRGTEHRAGKLARVSLALRSGRRGGGSAELFERVGCRQVDQGAIKEDELTIGLMLGVVLEDGLVALPPGGTLWNLRRRQVVREDDAVVIRPSRLGV